MAPQETGTDAAPVGVEVFVGSKHGVTAIEVVDGEVVDYALVQDDTVRDIARTKDGTVAAATDSDVVLGREEFEPTGFGPAVAVGTEPLLAAAATGDVARWTGEEWDPIGTLAGSVNAIDGDLVATDEGVCRVTDGGIQHVGLEGARDVSTAGIPHAATDAGLYKLGAGWMTVAEGAFTLVAADRDTAEAGVLGRAHAATRDQLFVYDGDAWGPWHIPVDDPVTGIGYADAVYAVSADGTLITATAEEWRTRHLGLSGVAGIAVGYAEENA
jgi:hypothetical protein